MPRNLRSWRSMRGATRSLGRAVAGHRGPRHDELRFDSWLQEFHGESLAELDAACTGGTGADAYRLFRELDDDLWAMLLTQQYDSYPHIRELLPDMPDVQLQELWNGASGLPLAVQSKDFYAKLRTTYQRHGRCALEEAWVLDFGCGWGRITRYLARDVRLDRLFGCDPVEHVLAVCRSSGVPGSFAKSEFLLDNLPFAEQFDLIYAFSVFTHLSQVAHERALMALHKSLAPGGVLVITIRPSAYLPGDRFRRLGDGASPGGPSAPRGPSYHFVPHRTNPWQAQPQSGEEIVYGETVVTIDYIRERWGSLFELLEAGLMITDPYQVMLTLRRV